MNNYISNINIWQEINEENISVCSKTERNVLNYLIYLNKKFTIIHLSQIQLARALKVDRSTIHRCCKSLVQKGYITMISGTQQNGKFAWLSNSYKVSENIIKSAHLLKNILPALKAYCNQVFIDLWNQNATPYKKEVINYLSHSMIVKHAVGTYSTLTQSYKEFKNKFTKRENEMEVAPLKVDNVLGEVSKALKLNQHGRIRLIIYPEKALAYGFAQLKVQKYLKTPFFWLLKFLDDYCKHNRLHIDWDMLPMLKKKYGISQADGFFEENKQQTVAYKAQPVVERISPLIGKHKDPHPAFAKFIPQDLRLDGVVYEDVRTNRGSNPATETEIYALQSV